METSRVVPGKTAERLERERPRMDPPNVLWFFGAFAIGFASFALIDKVPGSSRHIWELLVSLAFFAVYTVSARVLLRRVWWVPGGLTAALAAAMVPAVGFGLTSLIGTFPRDGSFDPTKDFSWSLFLIGLMTIAAGLFAFAFTRFSFAFFTVTVATALTAQLFLTLIDEHPSADAHIVMAIVAGAVLVAIGLLLDVAGARRDAFWFHVVGFLSVALALVYYAVPYTGDTNRGWVPMIALGSVVLLLAAPLRRATWAVYGVLGFYASIVHWLTKGVNASSTGYALLLLVIGMGIFLLGLGFRRSGRIGTRGTIVPAVER